MSGLQRDDAAANPPIGSTNIKIANTLCPWISAFFEDYVIDSTLLHQWVAIATCTGMQKGQQGIRSSPFTHLMDTHDTLNQITKNISLCDSGIRY